MREIKFRAWDKDLQNMKSARELKDLLIADPICASVIDDFVLEQFTGLLDKNGKEVFEGDVVERDLHGNRSIAVVVWVGDLASFMWQTPENCREGFTGGNADFFNTKTIKSNIGWKVIGNIHQHPELLK